MPTTLQNTNVLFNDSTTQGTAWIGYRGQAFTSSGTFTIPTGVTAIKATIVGGGGGGGGSDDCGATASGGSGGGTAIVYLTGLTGGNTIAVTIGAAGTAGSLNVDGGTGGNSTISSGTQTITTVTGGGGGGGRRSTQSSNAAGTTTNATFGINGQRGDTPGNRGGIGGATLFGLPGTTRITQENFAATGFGAGGNGYGGLQAATAGRAGLVFFEW